MKIKIGRKMIKICACCQTNQTKSKQAKYCENCSKYFLKHFNERINRISSGVFHIKKLLEDIKNGNSITN